LDVNLIYWVIIPATTAGVGLARKLAEHRRVRRELARRPALGAETPDGTVVRVTGTVRLRDTLIVAPLSGVECVAARARVSAEMWNTRGARKPREWFAIVSFLIERDGEPPVVVEGEHAEIALPTQKLARPKAGSDALHRREQLLLQLGIGAHRARGGGFEEVAVVPGMHVSVVGLMMLGQAIEPPRTDDQRMFRESPASTLRLVGNAAHPIVIGSPIA
jgi:hypothetical protein